MVVFVRQPNPGLPSTRHRRVACNFRDQSLFQIFQIALTSLSYLKNNAAGRLQELALSLALRCVSFDFVGTSIDESTEEVGTVQIPTSWRSVLEDPSTLQIFFDYYGSTDSPLSKEALECLVRLASVRRSMFTDDATRSKFLAHLMTGTKEILQTGKGLTDHDNYHVFCRLLGRFRLNYQLSELVKMDGYGDWIQLLAEFTLKSLQSWQWASSSVYHLLGMWSRLVASVSYLKGDSPSLLDEFVPKITEGFIISRFDSVQANVPDDPTEHPLDKVEVLQDELDGFPYLCRFQYERIGMYIINTMEPLLQSYTERGKLQFADNSELALIEAKLSWIVHIVAAIVKIKQCSGCSMETQEVLDAELSSRVLRLIDVMDSGLHIQRYGEISKQRLERAILAFFQNFRKSYVGDQAMHSSKQLYARLKDLRGLDDHLMLLNVIVGKIATNLKCYTQSEEVIGHTLSLFHELASGYMTGKLLLKLETVNFIVSNHTREQFPFLEEYRCSRSRTTFYYTIGWLIFMEDSSIKFKTSMEPLMQVFRTLESTPDSMFRTDAVKFALIGLMKSLRGISMASSSKKSYGILFDWLYPAHMPLLLRGISNWFDTPEVTTQLLKFMAEFVHNKNQRLTFDSSSPNGILLFREVSKLIVAYGSRILSLPNVADIYAFKYKGFWVSLTILSRALSGNYCNFGVFELYGDPALADALDIALKMTLSIPLADILTYHKLTKAYFGFVEVLCSSYITFILQLDSATFMHLVGSLESGLKGLDTSISSQCAIAVDNLATYYFNNITMGEAPNSPAAIRFAQHIADCPSLFPEILKTLFEIVLLEDCGNQWSLSRPILSLILISEQIFSDLKAKILSSQPVDQHQRLSACFDSLMTDISRGLDPKNRDMFTQNLNRFRLEFRVK
ncbi:exportin-7-B isoform X2 [Brassica rapa]|uniref:exportin-7-B isoform X2 n=1 Tax=Brassica campestris TaxID=3711 RepID=UPI000871EDD3|nr:exportin-7-B isoform X2 [Brassica rapa]XP_048598544.1 exportin-7-B isoform X2 [Brassica napus]